MNLEELTQEKIDILENSEEINKRTDLLLNSEPLKDYENGIGSWTRDLIRAVTIINVYQKNEFIKKNITHHPGKLPNQNKKYTDNHTIHKNKCCNTSILKKYSI